MVLQPDKVMNKIETIKNILDIRHMQSNLAHFIGKLVHAVNLLVAT